MQAWSKKKYIYGVRFVLLCLLLSGLCWMASTMVGSGLRSVDAQLTHLATVRPIPPGLPLRSLAHGPAVASAGQLERRLGAARCILQEPGLRDAGSAQLRPPRRHQRGRLDRRARIRPVPARAGPHIRSLLCVISGARRRGLHSGHRRRRQQLGDEQLGQRVLTMGLERRRLALGFWHLRSFIRLPAVRLEQWHKYRVGCGESQQTRG